jgi:hypothetical protein
VLSTFRSKYWLHLQAVGNLVSYQGVVSHKYCCEILKSYIIKKNSTTYKALYDVILFILLLFPASRSDRPSGDKYEFCMVIYLENI